MEGVAADQVVAVAVAVVAAHASRASSTVRSHQPPPAPTSPRLFFRKHEWAAGLPTSPITTSQA